MKIVLGILLVTAQAFAAGGASVGNGGGAIVCTDGDGKITRAELLDLREAEQASPGLVIPRSDEPKQAQLGRALARLEAMSPEIVREMREVLRDLDRKKVPVGGEYQLAPPTDTNLRVLKRERNCSLQGVASYDDSTDLLFVDTEILGAMSQTDQAALDFHEALYRVLRKGAARVKDSTAARKLTALMFLENEVRIAPPGSGSSQAVAECWAGDKYHFYVFELPGARTKFEFTKIGYRNLLDGAVVEIGPDSKQEFREVAKRATQGFPRYDAVNVKPKLLPLLFRTRSQFEPPYELVLRVFDSQGYCEPRAGSCRHWAWDPLKVWVNESVTLYLAHEDRYDAGVSVECTSRIKPVRPAPAPGRRGD